MISLPFRRRHRESIVAALYGTIVAQARCRSFYSEYGVPDTVAGRLDMIMLHLVLVLDRLKTDPALQHIGQQVFDLFCQDVDDNLREMGVGDLAVPKEMRRVGEMFYGRADAYERAFAGAETELVAALRRNIFRGEAANAGRLAGYVRAAMHSLAEQAGFGVGEVRFPEPLSIKVLEGNAS